jgi:hypothetical protein
MSFDAGARRRLYTRQLFTIPLSKEPQDRGACPAAAVLEEIFSKTNEDDEKSPLVFFKWSLLVVLPIP